MFYSIQEERGVYLIDEMFQWSTATTIFENFFLPPPFPPRAASSWDYVRGVCRDFFSNTAVLDYIRSSHYDVAIVDLIQNECMLSIPVSMGVPVVGFWMTLPIGEIHIGSKRRDLGCVIHASWTTLSSFGGKISLNLVHIFMTMLHVYRVAYVVANLGSVDLDLGVPPSCPTAQPLLPNSHQPRQN